MSGCQDFREDLTAWTEGQLPTRQHQRLSEHVTHCAQCAAEADSLRSAIVWQQRALRAVTSLDGVDPLALSARLRRELAAVASDKDGWRWRAPPFRLPRQCSC
jgi:anti-sigma factor RsiW